MHIDEEGLLHMISPFYMTSFDSFDIISCSSSVKRLNKKKTSVINIHFYCFIATAVQGRTHLH